MAATVQNQTAPKEQQEVLTQHEAGLVRLSGVLLALLPALSFVAQYLLSVRQGTQSLMARHLTVMIVDWVFIPFNFVVARVIDWRRGGRIYVIACVSLALNVLTYSYWQYNGIDLGHMITKSGVVLPAGWVHLVFSTLEMVLLVAFVFCRRPRIDVKIPTVLAVVYFVIMGICGYLMHGAFLASDVTVFLAGLFFVLLYPRLVHI